MKPTASAWLLTSYFLTAAVCPLWSASTPAASVNPSTPTTMELDELDKPLTGTAPARVGGAMAASPSAFDLDELDRPVQLVEPEFDTSILDSLPAPSEGSSQPRLPRPVVEKDQWRGVLCGIIPASHSTFRKSDTWDKFWTMAVRPYSEGLPPTPAIDFTKEMVIGVFAGEKPSPGYDIVIRSVKVEKHEDEQILVVRFQNNQQMQAVFTPPFTVRPYHLKKVPVFSGRIVFIELNR